MSWSYLLINWDWGSFAGGVIGTIGAFCAAKYTINKQLQQTKPKSYKDAYLLASSIKKVFNEVSWCVMWEHHRLVDFMIHSLSFKKQLENFIPDAIEKDRELLSLVEKVIDDIRKLNEKYSEKVKENNYTDYIVELSEIAEKGIESCENKMVSLRKNI